MERVLRSLGRVSAAAAKAAAERLILQLTQIFDEKHLRVMIRNDWYVIESIMWNLKHKPDYSKVPPELAREFELKRAHFLKMGVAALGFMKQIVSFFPPQLVKKYLNYEYALKYYRKHVPWIVKVIEEEPNGERWLKNQIKEIRDFLYKPSFQYSS